MSVFFILWLLSVSKVYTLQHYFFSFTSKTEKSSIEYIMFARKFAKKLLSLFNFRISQTKRNVNDDELAAFVTLYQWRNAIHIVYFDRIESKQMLTPHGIRNQHETILELLKYLDTYVYQIWHVKLLVRHKPSAACSLWHKRGI